MHPQLTQVIDDFTSASARLQALVARVPEARWAERADPARWSVSECVAHLNLTAAAFLPRIDVALGTARGLAAQGAATPARYRRDLAGWFLWRTAGPPVRLRARTTAPFVPRSTGTRDEIVTEFERLQAAQIERVRAADGLPIQRPRIQSPFIAGLSYNLYACLTILPRHEHRHLWQAERVWESS